MWRVNVFTHASGGCESLSLLFFYHKRVQASVIVLVLEPESRKNKQ